MSITQFISENKDIIDSVLHTWTYSTIDNKDRIDAILNDEGLYLLAVDNRVTYQGERI
jgi:hypothetical protein